MEIFSSFKCKCGCNTIQLDSKLVCVLSKIEKMHGHSLTILSGYRCPTHNKAVGGVDNSTHVRGLAADFTCINLHEVAGLLEQHDGGFKYYKDRNFIHVDVDKKRRW